MRKVEQQTDRKHLCEEFRPKKAFKTLNRT